MILFPTFKAFRDEVSARCERTRGELYREYRQGVGYPIRKSRGKVLIASEPHRTPQEKADRKMYEESIINKLPYTGPIPIPRAVPRDRFGEGCYEWKGTKAHLLQAIEEAKKEGYDELYIEEGFDGGETKGDFRDSSYQPWIGQYEVLVWTYTGDGPEVWASPAEAKEVVDKSN